jgi:hypothetical protein
MTTILSRRLPSRRSLLGALALGVVAAVGGCDTTGAFLADEDTPRYTEPACRVAAWWEPTVRYTPDPANNGAPLPGIAGRVYLMRAGSEIKDTLVGNGTLTIELFDEAQPPGPQGPAPVYHWSFDAATLQQLLRRDVVGWGYTLFLPCLPLRTDITHATLKVRYDQDKCLPLFAEPAKFSLSNSADAPAVQQASHNPGVRPRQ